MKYAPAGI